MDSGFALTMTVFFCLFCDFLQFWQHKPVFPPMVETDSVFKTESVCRDQLLTGEGKSRCSARIGRDNMMLRLDAAVPNR